ncbi:DUF3379 domain-containing protein [Marilutibacter chinensis]|uniref:DUF3379 domain-containing protein n=1 Tax=Marilutibacter chinensis TaxID=2912247 RepID=A0ABS9HST6_9GAMM|nr:DUF3379 domain-containing protein [Lysobacter chinensis]MCF7221980.1 DUF3379 domain-containing protein [Lysobacter chinensis]
MNDPSDKHDLPHDGNAHAPLPDGLRWQLRALRHERAPDRDLWPDIAARLPPRNAIAAPPRRPARWLAPVAMAASLLLVVGVLGWNAPLKPVGSPPPAATPALSRADAVPATTPDTATARTPSMLALETAGMARQYQAAFEQIGAVPVDSGLHPALAELDRNAELILQALSEQPDSRLLLERLHRTYARRLALSQRLVHS